MVKPARPLRRAVDCDRITTSVERGRKEFSEVSVKVEVSEFDEMPSRLARLILCFRSLVLIYPSTFNYGL
jgi:hypothetical protein